MKTLRASFVPILMAFLVLVSLRPVGAAGALLELAFAPTRVLAELAAPLRWARSSTFRSNDAALAERLELEGDAGAALVFDLRAAAEPDSPGLRLGRRLVPAEVFDDRQGDDLWAVLDPRIGLVGVRIGQPAVAGEAFVGRVAELDPGRNRVRVELVTGRSFFVGGVLEEPAEGVGGTREPLRMTIGGLDTSRKQTLLAVHNPSERAPRPGLVRVLEPDLDDDPASHLADGYLLGELIAPETGPWSVDPVVDFKSGLFHLSLLLPADTERPRDPAPLSTLRDGGWLATRPLSVGDPSAGRRGLVISTGSLAGVAPGAALIATTRFVGRVEPGRGVPPLQARVRLLGEPGLGLNVMARLDVDGSARILGGFTGLGMQDGAPVFEWDSVLGLEGLELVREVTATLYTGSGRTGVPGGLYLGRASLPVAAGRHVVALSDWSDGLAHGALWVRREPTAPGQPTGGGPR
ncbi:MAG: hypothetical protein P1V81_07925 [Planctomycetota bacterium]|nr:hypothetical protein [Planctomycetota bacterium]